MSYLFLYLAAINIIAFAAMGIDKAKARAGKWRIAEGTLFALAALGGALGGTLGMRVFHHKTKHKEFRFGFPALLCLQCAAVVYLILIWKQVLSEQAVFAYKCGDVYHPEDEGGLRYDDADISIVWPGQDTPILSEKDQNWPALRAFGIEL